MREENKKCANASATRTTTRRPDPRSDSSRARKCIQRARVDARTFLPTFASAPPRPGKEDIEPPHFRSPKMYPLSQKKNTRKHLRARQKDETKRDKKKRAPARRFQNHSRSKKPIANPRRTVLPERRANEERRRRPFFRTSFVFL